MSTNKNLKQDVSLTRKQAKALYKSAVKDLTTAIKRKRGIITKQDSGLYFMFRDLDALYNEINLLIEDKGAMPIQVVI